MAKKGSVLVVDDEEIMRDVLETLLSSEGYRVDLAKTGEEGLEAYGRRSYDVVLLDVSMPGMGGLRALEEFLKMDADAAVIMITAYATYDTAISAWEKGALGCIRKPFQNEQITATVASGIKRRRKEEERQTLRRAMSRAVDRGGIVGRSDVMQQVFRMVESSRARALDSSHHRRERHRQGTHRQSHTRIEPARTDAFCDRQLFKHSDGAFRVGTLRPHARRIHRRSRSQERII
jgi:Response regulator containing CheY-like receiver, AAA-type ATPase, and DNA-binding domains